MELLWALESIRSPFLDGVFGVITRLGEEMILILVFCALYWCVNKKMGYVMGVAFFLSSLVVQGMKIIFRIDRPWVVDPAFEPVGGAIRQATGYAFPSGHTQNAAALLGSLAAMLKPAPVKVACVLLAVLVAFSRMYLGVHFLSDVLVSLAVTFLLVWFAVKVVADDSFCKKRELILSLVIALCAIAVIVIAAALYHSGATEPRQLSDATRAAGAAIAFAIGMFVERVYIRFSVKTKNIFLQVVKFALGLAGTIAIQEGVRFIGTGLVIDAIRYFLMVAWITICYPLIIRRFFSVADKGGAAEGAVSNRNG